MSIWPHVMPKRLPSSDSDLVSPVIACLVDVYGALLGLGPWAEIDPLLMIRPPGGSCAFISRNACRAHRNEPVRFTSTTRCQSSTSSSSIGTGGATVPALLNSRSRAAVIGAHPVEEGLDRSGVADVGGDDRAGPVHPLALLGGFGQEICSPPYGHDVPAVAGQGQRRGFPQSGACSGHQRDLVVLHRRILAA